jgi:enoyl-CoA hydratase/carnithine racemase
MTSEASTDELLYEVRGDIGWLTFNRPQARNAFTFAMYDRLAEICSSPVEELPRVLIMTGAGDKAFAAGTDISQFLDFKTEDDVYGYEERINRVLTTIEDCPVPTIAAIRGACTGGGAGIAAACDLRVGSPSAVFGAPIARTLGNCLSIANYTRFASLIGAARIKEVVFTARLVGADESLAIGWLHQLVATEEELLEKAEELGRAIAKNAPLTLRATKMALKRIKDRATPESGRDLLKMCYLSEDFKEGVEAFLAKRPPVWQGR